MKKTFVLAVLLMVSGCSPPWSTVTSVEGNYSIEMPSYFVVERILPIKTALGTVDYRIMGSDPTRFKKFWPFWAAHGPYVAAHAELPPEDFSKDHIQQLFDHERNRLFDQTKRSFKENTTSVQIVHDRPITFQGYPGREVKIQLPKSRISRARMYLIDGRFYVLYGIGKNLEAFFDSFTLLNGSQKL